VQKGVLSGSGALAVSLNNTNTITPSGAQYQWTICSNTSAPCSQFLAPVTTTNLSTLLSSLVTAPRFAAGPTAFGYLDIEASPIPPPGGGYFNVTLGNGRVWNGTTWVNSGGGGLSCPAATGCTLGATVTVPSTSAMTAGTGGLSTTPDPYGEVYASPYPGGSFSGFRYMLTDSPGANNNSNGVYDHWSSGVVDYIGLYASSPGKNYPVEIANAAPTGSLTIDASGNTIISGGTNVVYICSGGTFDGLLSTSSAACTSGTGTATHLKIE
jgi:hypothetical protein